MFIFQINFSQRLTTPNVTPKGLVVENTYVGKEKFTTRIKGIIIIINISVYQNSTNNQTLKLQGRYKMGELFSTICHGAGKRVEYPPSFNICTDTNKILLEYIRKSAH